MNAEIKVTGVSAPGQVGDFEPPQRARGIPIKVAKPAPDNDSDAIRAELETKRAELEESLPDDLRECFKLLQEANAMPIGTRREQLTRELVIKIVSKKSFDLQQAPPSLPVDANRQVSNGQHPSLPRLKTWIEGTLPSAQKAKEQELKTGDR